MRRIIVRSLVALAAIATVALARSSTPYAQAPNESATQIEALTAEIAALRLEIDRLSAESTDVTTRTAALENGLATVAKEAEALSKVLDQSERQGFTAGINHESRVTLLTGWRRYLGALSAAGPKVKSTATANARER